MNNRAFSLIELLISVAVIGILVMASVPRYIRLVEKSRSTEARNILAQIRAAQISYSMEYDFFSTNLTNLQVDAPSACNSSFYFRYSIVNGSGTFTATANRCTGGQGKAPTGVTAFALNITQAGELGGTAGFL